MGLIGERGGAGSSRQQPAEAGRAYFLALSEPFTENRLKCFRE